MNWLLLNQLCCTNFCESVNFTHLNDTTDHTLWTVMRKWWKQSLYDLLFTYRRYKRTCPGRRVWSVGDIVHSSCVVRPQFVSYWHSAWIFCNGIYHHYFYLHITVMLIKQAVGIMSTAMNIMLTNMSVYCTASKKNLSSCNHFFHAKYLLAVYECIVVIPAFPHCVQAGLNVTFSDSMI